jgi:long-chain acyl-CoA synthetase
VPLAGETMVDVWTAAVGRAGGDPAFLAQDGHAWRAIGWQEAGRWVDELAAGFLELGVTRGDPVAIVGRTRVEWSVCDQALIAIGAIVVPLYPTASDADWAHILRASRTRMIVAENAALAGRIDALRPSLAGLAPPLTMQALPGRSSLDEVVTLGRRRLEADPSTVERARAQVTRQDALSYVATSGTTGAPKICVLTHANWWAMTDAICRVPGLLAPGDVTVLHLPLAHVFGRLIHFVGPAIGMTIGFCPDAAGLGAALGVIRPTVFASVPRVFEMLLVAVARGVEESGLPFRVVSHWGLATGRQAAARRAQGRVVGRSLGMRLALADRLVLARIRARLGGRLRLAISGGASLGAQTARAFGGLGIPLLEGYGLTECTAVAATNSLAQHRAGTVGHAVPGVELSIAADGEILTRGETVFAGYLGDARATGEITGPDGWLRTGDVGWIDPDGFLVVTDRKRDILVTARGWNIAPQKVETALEASRFIAQALVVGDRRPFVGALIAPSRIELRRAGHADRELPRIIREAVDQANRGLGQAEQVRRFVILDREFSSELGEVTPTLKLRRAVCSEHFRDEIEGMYGVA